MTVFLRVLRLLSITVWVGGLIFFAFVLAPTVFHVLPSTHEAGTVVGATLRLLNRIGPYCGYIFILASLASVYRIEVRRSRTLLLAQVLLVWLMIGTTQYVQSSIIPAMERDRIAAGGDIDAAPPNNPARMDFNRLHPISEKIEGSALLFGILVVILMGFEENHGRATPAA